MCLFNMHSCSVLMLIVCVLRLRLGITILQVYTKDDRILGSLHQSDAQKLAQLWRSARPWIGC